MSNPIEIQQAAQGSQIGNRPIQEVEEIVNKLLARLSIPTRNQPKGDALRYIADQMYRRHRYTLDELWLAVDYYNSNQLAWEMPGYTTFGVQHLNSLMSSYRTIAARATGQQEPEIVQSGHTQRLNEEAAKQACRQIYEAMKRGEDPAVSVMYVWMIAHNYLIRQGKINCERMHAFRPHAEKMYKADLLSGKTIREMCDMTKLGDAIKFGQSVENYQAMLVVKEYFRSKLTVKVSE